MSEASSYISEPETRGKVVISTTFGDLDVELWSKECPLAVRNFIQLCLEGYYDNCPFTRVIKNFMAQTGDPTGTGAGGESIYGGKFKDEFHSRLRFNRRGLVAMANSGKDSNQSQFFFTLGETPWLQKKNTLFGKVTGDTVFNLIKLNDYETDQEDRLTMPQRIKKIDVVLNPFSDIVPRSKKVDKTKKKKEKKKKKQLELLSFGEEAEKLDEELEKATEKVASKSAHDLVKEEEETSLKNEEAEEEDSVPKASAAESVRNKLKKQKETETRPREAGRSDQREARRSDQSASHQITAEEKDFDAAMRDKVLAAKLEQQKGQAADVAKVEYVKERGGKTKDEADDEYKELKEAFEKSEAKKARKLAKEEKEAEKRAGKTRGRAFKRALAPDDEILSALEKRQAKYRKFKRGGAKEREKDTLDKLDTFMKTLRQAPEVKAEQERLQQKTEERLLESKKKAEAEARLNPQTGIEDEKASEDEDEDDTTAGWMAHKMKFAKRPQDYKEAEDVHAAGLLSNYAIFDPLDANQQERPETRKQPRDRDTRSERDRERSGRAEAAYKDKYKGQDKDRRDESSRGATGPGKSGFSSEYVITTSILRFFNKCYK
eukprot:g416.t1